MYSNLEKDTGTVRPSNVGQNTLFDSSKSLHYSNDTLEIKCSIKTPVINCIIVISQ